MSRSIREKGTVTKVKSLFVGSFEISAKKSASQVGQILLSVDYMGMYFCNYKEYGFSIEPLL